MKVVFVGPSLHGASTDWSGLEPRPPAAQGDVFAAVNQGATAIGLIDGYFGSTASVWHKEILFALAQGVRMLGGGSMGALRAAECAPFGMEPVGSIAARYLSEELDDDSLVALSHGPAEVGFAPVTEALVDMLATFERLMAANIITSADAARLTDAARATFFQERTLAEVIRRAGLSDRPDLERCYAEHFSGIKRADAIAVVERLRALPATRGTPPIWRMQEPPTWRQFVATNASSI